MDRTTLLSPAEIGNALSWIDAQDRDIWLRMAMAVKSALGEDGFSIWDVWSRTAGNYQEGTARAVWRSISASGGVTIASLVSLARQNGCPRITAGFAPDPAELLRREVARQAANARHRRVSEARQRAARDTARRLWALGQCVDPAHRYVAAKQIVPCGARQWQSQLMVPVTVDEELVNLQIIDADGSKRFLTGGRARGAWLTLGVVIPGEPLLFCEGWATGCSLHQACALPVVITFGAANLVAVARRFRQRLARWSEIWLCADRDDSGVGLARACEAAELLAPYARVRVPEFQPSQREQHQQHHGGCPSDFNDLQRLAGAAAVRAQVCGAPWRDADDLAEREARESREIRDRPPL